MSFATVLFTPFVLLFPAAGVIGTPDLYEPAQAAAVSVDIPPGQSAMPPGAEPVRPGRVFREMAGSFRAESQNQVRIERHMEIRITPARPMPFPGEFPFDRLPREIPSRLIERDIGRCVPASGIARVQPDRGNRLILFMRDRRMIGAQLERTCRARDFYSGFYISRTPDGRICVDRDTLLSRSGANCRLSRLSQLIDPDD
ncbi:MAG: hypothetical protein LBV50_07605 [Novosphingobium sp.]|jgi:hypothetical protein|nr:hypothetical protein [Novosphingobium sp.]